MYNLHKSNAFYWTKFHLSHPQPLFLYVSYQAVHKPLQVPEQYLRPYKHFHDNDRRLYAGMTTCMDQGVGNITRTLKKMGLWEDSVLIFSSGKIKRALRCLCIIANYIFLRKRGVTLVYCSSGFEPATFHSKNFRCHARFLLPRCDIRKTM